MPLLPMRNCFVRSARSGSVAISLALTSRCSPLAVSVTTITGRRAARSTLTSESVSNFTTSAPFPKFVNHRSAPCTNFGNNRGTSNSIIVVPPFDLKFLIRIRGTHCRNFKSGALPDFLDKHLDGAAAGQADIPRGLVGDAEFEHLRLAAGDHIERLGDDRALDAAAGHRAQKRAVIVDHEARTRGPRRRAPGLDHGRQRHAMTGLLPVLGRFQNVLVAIEHGKPLFKLLIEPGCGDAAAMPTKVLRPVPRSNSNYVPDGIRQRAAASF